MTACAGRARAPLGSSRRHQLAQAARPQPHFSCSQSRVRHFKNDAAHIFVSEEIVAGELQVVLRAFHVAEERVSLRQPEKNESRLPL